LKANPKANGTLQVAPGVWALVQPFGVDLAGTEFDRDERRQFGFSCVRSVLIPAASKLWQFDRGISMNDERRGKIQKKTKKNGTKTQLYKLLPV